MKIRVILLAVLLMLCVGVTLVVTGCGKGTPGNGAAKAAQYHCPMHPTVVADKPGECPICGMNLVPIEAMAEGAGTPAEKFTRYRSTMNPGEVSDTPGKDSMGMEMEAFDVESSAIPTPAGRAAVSISPEVRQRMGLKTSAVEKRQLTGEIRTSARIVADEKRLYRVTAKFEGWVDELLVAVTGQEVHKGDPLATVYSPELVSAQQEYLIALEIRDKFAAEVAAGSKASTENGEALLAAARRRLELWDISTEQINRLETSHKVEKSLTLSAPADGWVTERMVLPGQRIMPTESLMVVSDLCQVWADADIYPADAPYVKTGMAVEVSLSYGAGSVFTGKVSFVSPTLDPMTRTLKARLEIPNPDLLLKPEMYATAHLRYDLGETLAVPTSAVLFSGTRTLAFRDAGDGQLVPVELGLGARAGDYYEVRSGLAAGDQVVVSANFLVDSESSMRAALESMTEIK